MKGSSSYKGSGSSTYLGKSKSPTYSGSGGKVGSYIQKSSLGGGNYQSKNLGYLVNNNSGIRYNNPIVPEGYSKGSHKGVTKSGYLEMAISNFSTPFDQQAQEFNVCQVCGAPVPPPFKKCINCSASKSHY